MSYIKKNYSAISMVSALVLGIFLPVKSANAQNAAPLGLELGVADMSQVKKDVGSKTTLSPNGVNKYSHGPMLESNGNGLGIDGLTDIVFIFDTKNKLAGVLMTLPKQESFGDMENSGFKKVYKSLSSKYKIVKKNIQFVGDSYALFKQGDSVVELNAPHLSFDMQVNYLTNSLSASFKDKSTKENAIHSQEQTNKF